MKGKVFEFGPGAPRLEGTCLHFGVVALCLLTAACKSEQVPPPPVDRLEISTTAISITGLLSSTVTVSAYGSRNEPIAAPSVTWSSSDPTVVTVQGSGTSATLTAKKGGSAVVSANSGKASAQVTVTVRANVQNVTIPTGNFSLEEQTTQTLTATVAADPNVETSVSWQSSVSAVATITQGGVVTALSTGTSVITATSTYDAQKSASVTVTVTRGVVTRVVLTMTRRNLLEGDTATARAVALNRASGTLASRSVSLWGSSNTSVATVDARGIVTAVAPGAAAISAEIEGVIGRDSVFVSQIPVNSVSVVVDSSLKRLQTTRATAIARDDKGNQLANRRVSSWESSDPAIVTVDATGLVTAVGEGSARISATVEGKKGTSPSIVVRRADVARVVVSLARRQLVEGDTLRAQHTASDAAGTSVTGLPVTWVSTNTNVASVGATGLITAIAAGSTSIIATVDGVSASDTLRVIPIPVQSVDVALSRNPLPKLETATVTVTPRDSLGRPLSNRAITLSSSVPAVATIAGNIVTAVSEGTTAIGATVDGVSGNSLLTVSRASVDRVVVSISPSAVAPGDIAAANATAYDRSGGVLAGRAVDSWTSSVPGVATVNAVGNVTAVSAGKSAIIATIEGKQGIDTITVATSPFSIVAVLDSAGVAPVPLSALRGVVTVSVRIPSTGSRPDSVRIRLGSQIIGVQRTIPAGCASASCTVSVGPVATSAYTVTSGSTTPQIPNGAASLVAEVFNPGSASPRVTPSLAVVLANTDAFHVIITPPAVSAQSSSGQTWYGGPSGPLTAQLLPVSYSGKSISALSFRFGGGPVVSLTSGPFTATIGTASSPSYQGYQSPGGAPEGVTVVSASYAGGAAAPTTIANAYSRIRIDYAPPTGSFVLNGTASTARWISGAYDFTTGVSTTDAGVGLQGAAARTFEYAGCGSGTFIGFNPALHAIGECASITSNAAYSARVSDRDLLGNQATIALGGGNFGVDRTPPTVQITGASDSSIFSGITSPPTTIFDATYADTRSGTNSSSVEVSLMFYRPASGAARCAIGGGSPGSSFLSNPQCGFAAGSSGAVGLPAGEISGWLGYRVRIRDVAGNVSNTLRRSALVESAYFPAAQLVTAQTPISAPQTITMGLNISDDVELHEAGILFKFPAAGAWVSFPYFGYPIQNTGTLPSSPFDDIATSTVTTFTTPTGFPGWMEPVSPLDSVQPPAAYGGTGVVTDIVPRGSDHSRNESIPSPGAFPSLPAYTSWYAWNQANPSSRVLTFKAFASLSYALPQQGLKAEVATPLGTPASPFHRIDWYAARGWDYLGGSSVWCYVGSSYNGGSGITVNNTTVWRYAQTVAAVIKPSCSDWGTVGVSVGVTIVPVGVRSTMEGLVGRPITVTP